MILKTICISIEQVLLESVKSRIEQLVSEGFCSMCYLNSESRTAENTLFEREESEVLKSVTDRV